MVGRRGVGQVQFTTIELREMAAKIEEIDCFVDKAEFDTSIGNLSKEQLYENAEDGRIRNKMHAILETHPDFNKYLENPAVSDAKINKEFKEAEGAVKKKKKSQTNS